MGIIAFVLIFGPWIALVALLWRSGDRFADARLDLFQRSGARPAGSTAPGTKAPEPPSAVEPIAEIRPLAAPSPIAGPATLTGQ